jgi:predicted ATPase
MAITAQAAFDLAIESVRQRASTTTSPRGLKALPVRPEPTRSAQLAVQRSLAGINPDLRAVIRRLVSGESPWPLYLWGPAGTGKTSAALCVLDHCGVQRKSTARDDTITTDMLFGYTEVRSLTGLRISADKGGCCPVFAHSEKYSAWPAIIDHWKKIPVAVIDEIGVGGYAADFRLDSLLEVLNTRCSDPVKPLIVTSNVEPRQIEADYDDRVASRILAGTVYHVAGDDRRIRRAA